MEDSEKFIKKGESQITQYASRSGALQNQYLNNSITTNSSTPETADYEGDIVMGGMKIDLHSLATLVAKVNIDSKGGSNSRDLKPKPPAAWLTETEVNELIKKKLCLRCKKGGHVARYCNRFGPAKRPMEANNVEYSLWGTQGSNSNSGKE